jgi:tight adherence protein B
MSGWVSPAAFGVAVLAALWLIGRGSAHSMLSRRLHSLPSTQPSVTDRPLTATGWARARLGPWALRGLSIVIGGFIGMRLAGPPGLLVGFSCGWGLPRLKRRRAGHARTERLERQLADVVETAALAVRSGLSLPHAVEFAAGEADEPMATLLRRLIDEQRLGVPFEDALHHFAEALQSDDARLFVLVVSIHVRSGGNLAGALEEVSGAIHHRFAVRRELRALSAQSRISGAILGALPIVFFLVLSATSRNDLGPVYRSPAGIAMISTGLAMEGLAYLWIRRLMRVEV